MEAIAIALFLLFAERIMHQLPKYSNLIQHHSANFNRTNEVHCSEGAPECSSFQPSEIIDSVLIEDHVNICEMFHGCQCDSWEHNDTKCCHHVPISLRRLLRNADSEDEGLETNDYHVI